MNDEFAQLTDSVMEYMTETGHGHLAIQNYSKCFELLGKHLSESGSAYSPEAADKWLNSIAQQLSQTRFDLFSAALKKLNDMYFIGKISSYHSDPNHTNVGRLCPEFNTVYHDMQVSMSEMAEKTITGHNYYCVNILLDFQNFGIFHVRDISYEILLQEFYAVSGKSYYSQAAHHANLRFLLDFLYQQGKVRFGFTLFVDGMATKKGYHWNSVPHEELLQIKEEIAANKALSLNGILAVKDSLYQKYQESHYSKTAKNKFLHIMNLFYLFMDINELLYLPIVGHVWLKSIEPTLSTADYKQYRRVLCLIEKAYKDNQPSLAPFFVFKETIYSHLPDWCKGEIDNFLILKAQEGLDVSTINMYRASICRFCSFLDKSGIQSYDAIAAEDIKTFNKYDQHKTIAGKNAYNTRIRKFLEYLGESDALSNPYLFMALPCLCAAKESLVITLTDQEQEQLQELLAVSNTTLSLRTKAILQLGLYMGLRSSDIIGIKIDDIDWANSSLRILQEKTDYEIILPMPISVANAVYRYIMYERPDSESRNVFVKKVAPYTPLSGEVCRRALNEALPGRDPARSGFHVTRKTYATNLLNNDVPYQHVAEALGHQGVAAVAKYLSLDETRMRLCGLSLAEQGISMKGGFSHE